MKLNRLLKKKETRKNINGSLLKVLTYQENTDIQMSLYAEIYLIDISIYYIEMIKIFYSEQFVPNFAFLYNFKRSIHSN